MMLLYSMDDVFLTRGLNPPTLKIVLLFKGIVVCIFIFRGKIFTGVCVCVCLYVFRVYFVDIFNFVFLKFTNKISVRLLYNLPLSGTVTAKLLHSDVCI